MEAIFIHSDPAEEKLFLPEPENQSEEIHWTRVMNWKTVNVTVGAKYSFHPGSPPPYIKDDEIGITDVHVELNLERGNPFINNKCGKGNVRPSVNTFKQHLLSSYKVYSQVGS